MSATGMHMKVVSVVVLLAACVLDEPSAPLESQTESAVTDGQGTDYQGTDYQGTDYQGTDYQGTDYQGTDYQGTDYQGTAYANVTISGTSLVAWKQLPDQTWEMRSATRICHYNVDKTVVLEPCTVVDLSVSPSPLAGTLWPAKFTKYVNRRKMTVTGTIRIGTGPTDLAAVNRDTSLAMHPLDGTPAVSCQPLTTPCSNPRGCRANCDLFTYKLYLLDGEVVVPFCQGGARAYALAGTWSGTGQYSSSTSRFSFACANGTVAKCTRWGYRSWGTARRSDGVTASTSVYHQACVRAAAADYCANGHSFTKNGTLVDIYDYGGLNAGELAAGFVPATQTAPYDNNVLLWESSFDKYGAVWLDHVRYEETSAELEDPAIGCPTRWWQNGSDDVGANYNRLETFGTVQNIRIAVSNTTSCAHSEQTVGKWLDRRCNAACVGAVDNLKPYCTDPHDARGWDQGCVNVALSKCKPGVNPPMAIHSECTAGAALGKYDSACTLMVCGQNPECCNNSLLGWTSACVNLANAKCRNGRESVFSGFCMAAIITPPLTTHVQ
jgi:hypothetical protein